MEKVTVILPTFNRANLINRSIDSVLKQTWHNLQLIVVDDGSDDNTEDVVKQIDDNRITYIRKDKNEGVSSARNLGVQMADTEFIAFQDSDDVWQPQKLEKQMKKMQSENYAMVYCSFAYHGMNQLELVIPNENMPIEEIEGNIYPYLLKRNFIGTPTMVLTKESFVKTGGFDCSFPCLEDYDFILRLARENQVGAVREPLVDVYAQKQSMTNNVAAELIARCLLVGKYKKDMLSMNCFNAHVNYIIQNAAQNHCQEQIVAYLEKVLSV